MEKVGILIIDNDEASQSAMRQILDSDGWTVRIVGQAEHALGELSTGAWSLVVANISMTGLSGPIFSTLRELALAPAMEAGRWRARVLFIVPESVANKVRPILEGERLPYVLRPFEFSDFIDKVSDLLMETSTLAAPIRRVRHDARAAERKRQETRAGQESDVRQGRRGTEMFSTRDRYVMTEEEIAEFEREEQQQAQAKKKKEPGRH